MSEKAKTKRKKSQSQNELDHIKEIKMNKQKTIGEVLKNQSWEKFYSILLLMMLAWNTDTKMCGITSKQEE